jgi:hypothetical protein
MGKLAKVEGEVVVKDGTGTSVEFYESQFVLDDAVQNAAQARAIIKKGLISERLRREVQGYKRVRTCQIVEFTSTDDKPEQSDMDRLLIRATELNCVPENIDNYKRPDFKQRALEKAIEKAEERAKSVKPDAVQDLGYVD